MYTINQRRVFKKPDSIATKKPRNKVISSDASRYFKSGKHKGKYYWLVMQIDPDYIKELEAEDPDYMRKMLKNSPVKHEPKDRTNDKPYLQPDTK
jgi:hypothetical protein